MALVPNDDAGCVIVPREDESLEAAGMVSLRTRYTTYSRSSSVKAMLPARATSSAEFVWYTNILLLQAPVSPTHLRGLVAIVKHALTLSVWPSRIQSCEMRWAAPLRPPT